MTVTTDPEFQRRVAIQRRAKRRLLAAFKRRRLVLNSARPQGDGYWVKVKGKTHFCYSYRGLRQIWLRLFPKRRGRAFHFRTQLGPKAQGD